MEITLNSQRLQDVPVVFIGIAVHPDILQQAGLGVMRDQRLGLLMLDLQPVEDGPGRIVRPLDEFAAAQGAD